MSSALVPGRSGQLLPPGQEKKKKKKNLLADSLHLAISLAVQSLSLCPDSMCVPDPAGKRHYPAPCGSQGRSDLAG